MLESPLIVIDMDHREARELIRDGVAQGDGSATTNGAVWADLGAGTGTFTRALAQLLEPGSTIYAVDKSARAVKALRTLRLPNHTALIVVHKDFLGPLDLPALDGLLMANALHYAEDQAAALRRITGYLRPEGRFLLVEYDRTRSNRWVPFPVPPSRLEALAAEGRLSGPQEVGRRSSSYGREMYAALMRRQAGP